jgi:hypothetical protein
MPTPDHMDVCRAVIVEIDNNAQAIEQKNRRHS